MGQQLSGSVMTSSSASKQSTTIPPPPPATIALKPFTSSNKELSKEATTTVTKVPLRSTSQPLKTVTAAPHSVDAKNSKEPLYENLSYHG